MELNHIGKMSTAEINRIFKLIEDQYVTTGRIDPHDRETLFKEMREFDADAAERLIQHISKVFNEISDEDDEEDDDGEPIETKGQRSQLVSGPKVFELTFHNLRQIGRARVVRRGHGENDQPIGTMTHGVGSRFTIMKSKAQAYFL